MENNQPIVINSFVVPAESASGDRPARGRLAWTIVLGACGVSGFVSGITGLMLSAFAAGRILENSRGLSLVVTILIICSLGLLLCGAHAMDRIDEINRSTQ